MREIILDTETTGLDPATGDRLVEIACVEVLNFIPTGEHYHTYLDPERDVPEGAFRVHGLSTEFLKGKPLFKDAVADFLAFIGDSRLVIHNAEFDMKFLNAELQRAGLPLLPAERAFDTLAYARRKHPGAANSLDALCTRYKIDNSRRTKHGALMDSEILAEVYAELMGGRQAALSLQAVAVNKRAGQGEMLSARPEALPARLTGAEIAAHRAFVSGMSKTPLWDRYADDASA